MPNLPLKRVYIEIINTCNLHCPFCTSPHSHGRMMSMEQFQIAAQQAATLANHIYLHVLGEPLLHPMLPEFIAYAESLSLNVNITTNGTRLLKLTPQLIQNPPRLISISLHDWHSNFPQEQQNQLLNDVICAADRLEPYTYVSFRLWNRSSDYNETPEETEFNNRMRQQLADHYNINISDIQPIASNPLTPRIFLQNDRRFSWPSPDAVPVVKKHCLGLKQQIAILSDGTIVPCCIDAHATMPLGNIFEGTTLSQAIASPRAQKIITGFRQHKAAERTCQLCGFHRY